MRAEIKVHFKKKETQINIKVPLTQEEREIIAKCIIELVEKLKVDDVKINRTNPYKELPKEREELKEVEISLESNKEILKKEIEEIDKFNQMLEEWLQKGDF